MVGACPYPVPQGSQVLLTETARALQAVGDEVHLVVYGYGAGPQPMDVQIHRSARFPGANRFRAGPSFAKPLQDLAMIGTLRSVVRAYKVNIVHAHNYEALAVALASRKRPVVYHAHNLMSDELPFYFGGATWASKAGRLLDRTLPRRADAVIALHTRQAEALVREGVAESRIHVIPPPVAINDFPVERERVEIASVLYTGNLDSYQNISLLNRVHNRVLEREPRADFVVATSDTRETSFGRKVETPDFETLRQCLSQDVVMVSPRASWSGYPMKILNGMAAGLPIVALASACGPLEDGVTGRIVDDGDADGFAEAVLALMGDGAERERLGSAARAYVEAHHGHEAIGRRLAQVHATVTSGNKTD